jgi:hypothetical protein
VTLGSIRHEIRIHRPAAEVWALAGDATRLHEWFPGIVACTVTGSTRVITTSAGLPMPEEILVVDPVQRRFQYRITAPLFRHLGDDTSLVVYSTEADPRTMALTIGGGTAGALDELRRIFEPAPVA